MSTFDIETMPELEGYDFGDVSDELREGLQLVPWTVLPNETMAHVQQVLDMRAKHPGAIPVVPIPGGFRCYCYVDFERKIGCFVWDSREESQMVPGTIKHASDGSELILYAHSIRILSYPLRQGDRVFITLTEQRARIIVTEMLQDMERNHPGAFAELSERYESRDEAIQVCVDQALMMEEPDLVEVTAALLQDIEPVQKQLMMRFQAAIGFAEKTGNANLARLYTKAIAPFVRHCYQTRPHWQGKDTLEALVATVVHERFDRAGKTLSEEDWAGMIEDGGYTTLAHTSATMGVGAGHVAKSTFALDFFASWIGLDFEALGDRERIGPMICAVLTQSETRSLVQLQTDAPNMQRRTRPAYMWHARAFEEVEPFWNALMRVLQTEEWQRRFRSTVGALQGDDLSDEELYKLLDALLLTATMEAHGALQRQRGAVGQS